MRLPFASSRKAPERTMTPEPERTSSEGAAGEQTLGGGSSGDDGASDRSTAHSTSMPLDTPATSYSSTTSASDRQGKKMGMYKLSVVDDSGTFLPPSPPDHARESGMRAWSLHRKSNKSRERVSSFDGPFIISRESFEGYRRSFDIGRTSPTLGPSPTFSNSPRLSLDSNISAGNGSISSRTGSRLRPTSIPKVEEGVVAEAPFEDVKLEDDDKVSRRTKWSRFGFGGRTSAPRKKDGEELQSFQRDDD